MKPTIPAEMFQTLKIPRREVLGASLLKYRVFSDATHFVLVEADNAQTALSKSGISNAFRIEQETILLKNIINLDEMKAEQPATPVPQESAPAEIKPAEEPPTPAPPTALSPDDVDKLLQS